MAVMSNKRKEDSAMRWVSYAKAAGVGALTMGAASTADAAIVVNGGTHNDNDPAVLPIVVDPVAFGYKNSFDIDGDGARDFFMGTGNYGSVFGQLDGANTAGMILSSGAVNAYAGAFAEGAIIDGTASVPSAQVAVITESSDPDVGFGDGSRGFMGFKTSSGYFGWMDVSTIQVPDAGFNDIDDLQLTIHGWAIDNSGAGIEAGTIPEPSSLALLAAGSVGILARRRRKNVS